MNKEIPEGWREVSVGNILTKEQQKEIEDFVKAKNKAKKKIIDCITELKKITGKWRQELLEKGMDSDFLAYTLASEYTMRGK